MITSRTLPIGFFIVLIGTSRVLAQAPSIANATIETRQLTRALDAEIAALVAEGTPRWIGYRVPIVRRDQRFCGSDRASTLVLLEPPTEMFVLVRTEGRAIAKIRTVTPDCEIDAGGMPVVWLENVRVEDSIRWLTDLIRTESRPESAISALALHPGQAPITTLITMARDDVRPRVRGQALFWLSQRAGDQAVAAIGRAVDNDPEIEVKRRAVFALSQLPKAEGVPLLIEVARTHRNAEVRRQAMFWLGQSRDPRAVDFFEQVLRAK